MDEGYRWNGAEFESIFNEKIMKRSGYIVGLFDGGHYWNHFGNLTNRVPEIGIERHMLEAYHLASNFELGQGKLFSLMFGFAQSRNIIYVGASPGEGWQKALRIIRPEITVYSFDPDPIYELDESQAKHFTLAITHPDDIWNNVPDGVYDFIWDVRGDTHGAYDRSESVLEIVKN